MTAGGNLFAPAPTQRAYTTTSSSSTTLTYSATGSTTVTWNPQWQTVQVGGRFLAMKQDRTLVDEGTYELPDGSLLHVDATGNFRIEDTKAKVVYKANRMREFNPFVNAADLIAEFIRDAGQLGISAQEVAALPLSLLVNWLVLGAAEADGDPVPEGVQPLLANPIVRHRKHPRCQRCQHFIPRVRAAAGILICSPQCFRALVRKAA